MPLLSQALPAQHVNRMTTTTLAALGLIIALVAFVPAAMADGEGSPASPDCLPLWVDAQGGVHVDWTCTVTPLPASNGP